MPKKKITLLLGSVLLVASTASVYFVALTSSVSAFQDAPTTRFFLCDGTATLAKDNPHRVECSVGLVGPFSDSTGTQNVRLDTVCNGPSDAFGHPSTPIIDHPAGSNYAEVKVCSDSGTLVSASYTNTKTNAPITQAPTDTTVTPGPTTTPGAGGGASPAPGGNNPGGSAPTSAKTTCGQVLDTTLTDNKKTTAEDPNFFCIDGKISDQSLSKGCSADYAGSIQNGCGIIQRYVNPIIKFLALGFGIIVTIMIAVSGLQYSSAGGDPQKIAAAKKRIFNAIFALVSFGLLYGFLNFIIPGGL